MSIAINVLKKAVETGSARSYLDTSAGEKERHTNYTKGTTCYLFEDGSVIEDCNGTLTIGEDFI